MDVELKVEDEGDGYKMAIKIEKLKEDRVKLLKNLNRNDLGQPLALRQPNIVNEDLIGDPVRCSIFGGAIVGLVACPPRVAIR